MKNVLMLYRPERSTDAYLIACTCGTSRLRFRLIRLEGSIALSIDGRYIKHDTWWIKLDHANINRSRNDIFSNALVVDDFLPADPHNQIVLDRWNPKIVG